MSTKDKRFRVYRSSPDGVTGGEGDPLDMAGAARQVGGVHPWETRSDFNLALAKWARRARPGDGFKAGYSLIVCVMPEPNDGCPCCGAEEGLSYADFSLDGGDLSVVQEGRCGACLARWEDRFVKVATTVIKRGKHR